MGNFPGSTASFAGFTSGHTLSQDSHASQHNLEQAEIVATQTKIGTGASTPISGVVLRGNGAGTSTWGQVVLTTDVTGTLPLANGGTGGASAATAAANLSSEVGKLLFPVGCIYTETTGVNPGTSWGFGTWVAFGAGQVLVGNGTSDQVFAAGATGGESNHTLSSAEMPSHTHFVIGNTAVTGANGLTNANYVAKSRDSSDAFSYGIDNGGTSTVASLGLTSATGSTGSHNNLQPYIVVYFWKRTV